MYAASDGLSTLVLERDVPGGQASHTSMIENFFGFPDGIGGAELARLAGRQAERFGAELVFLRGVAREPTEPRGTRRRSARRRPRGDGHVVLAATGHGLAPARGDGVDELSATASTTAPAAARRVQCAGDDVIVVGAGNSAGQAVLNLATRARASRCWCAATASGKTMSAYLVERISAIR